MQIIRNRLKWACLEKKGKKNADRKSKMWFR